MKDVDPRIIIAVIGVGFTLCLITVFGYSISRIGITSDGVDIDVNAPQPTATSRVPLILPSLDFPISESVTIRFINKCDAIIETVIYYENLQGDWVVNESILFQDEAKDVAITKNEDFYYHGHGLLDETLIWEGNDKYLTIQDDNKTYGFSLERMVEHKNPYEFSWRCK